MADVTSGILAYGEALFSLAEELGETEQVKSDIQTLLAVIDASPEYLKMLDSPALSREERLAKAETESEEILRTAQRRAMLKKEEILKEAAVEATRIRDRASEEIAMEKKRMLGEIKDEVSGMAIDIASAVIGREVSSAEHEKFIDSFIDDIG